MKNIFDILTGVGIAVPDEKKTEFETAFNENYKTVAEADKLRASRDNYKSQLETAQTALKEFDGVDIKDLNGKIDKLTNDLKTQKNDYQTKIADMEFNSVLESAIASSGAKNTKAVKALLDLDNLKLSKNQAEDIKNALETVKTENDFMFISEEPFKNPVSDTGNPPAGDNLSAVRAAMGLPAEK